MYANLSTIKMVEFLDIEIRARGKRNENGRKPKKKKKTVTAVWRSRVWRVAEIVTI